MSAIPHYVPWENKNGTEFETIPVFVSKFMMSSSSLLIPFTTDKIIFQFTIQRIRNPYLQVIKICYIQINATSKDSKF